MRTPKKKVEPSFKLAFKRGRLAKASETSRNLAKAKSLEEQLQAANLKMESVIAAALGQITIYKSLNNSLDMTKASIQDNIKALRDYQA